MSAPVIGISTYGRNAEHHFHLPAEYVDSVRRAGGVPVLLAPGESQRARALEVLDGLILAGGGDLDPETYGGERHATNYMVDAERDQSELLLAQALLESDLPGLCICRGTQVLNVALGGTLIEHVPDEVGEEVVHRAPPREPIPHGVRVEAGSRLAGITGVLEFESVSWHHQAVRELGRGLSAVAFAADGIVEAVELADRPDLVCVQWHPELSAATDAVQQGIFDHLVALAAERGVGR